MMVRGQWANLARMPGLHPYSFSKDILGFLMSTASQDLGLTSHLKDGRLIRLRQLDHWSQTQILEGHSSVQFSSNPNQTRLIQLIKVFRGLFHKRR